MAPRDDLDAPTLTPSQANIALTPTLGAADDPAAAQAMERLPGYALGALIGRGGMGEVIGARDLRIGRDVAIKRIRPEASLEVARARFLREAQVQARLEHPAIVPVYELGEDGAGRPYFTMKRLAGRTLAEVLAEPAPPRQRLLRAVVEVCQAIEFAHARGVVHRDLKPANIMLGDFGEVYVLDWGVARILGDGEAMRVDGDIASLDGHTSAGSLLGTPGYMAPEQVRGEGVDRAADVYALGAILFEVLCGEPLHPRGAAALATTVAGLDPSAARRRPEAAIPPELDGLCAEALALEATARPSARDLAARVTHYLDGDRDLARRRALATDEVTAARAALASGDSALAMRTAGRALALDPGLTAAAELVSALMLAPPRELPAPLLAELAESDRRHEREQARAAARAFLMFLLFAPFALFAKITSWPVLGGLYATVLVMAVMAPRLFLSQWRGLALAIAGNAVLLLFLSRICGTFVLLPTVIAIVAAALMSYPALLRRRPGWVVLPLAACFAGPLVLEWLGVWGSTWAIEGHSLVITPTAIDLGGPGAAPFLIAAHLAAIVVSGMFARKLALSRAEAQQRLAIQAWQLRQLLPASEPDGRGGR